MRRSIRFWISSGMIAGWVVAVAGGYLLLGAYGARPGDSGRPPGHWPVDTALRLDEARPNLLIFVHPRCPCSRASLAELGRIISRCRGRLSARAVVYRPDAATEAWSRSGVGIEEALAEIPDVPSYDDPNGVEARRFGISTSGHVLLFDASGRRIFTGGITASRGHEGENRGSDDVVALVLDLVERRGRPPWPAIPVFGCPIVTTNTSDDERS